MIAVFERRAYKLRVQRELRRHDLKPRPSGAAGRGYEQRWPAARLGPVGKVLDHHCRAHVPPNVR